MKFPTKQYDIILADPPWAYYGQQDKWAAAAKFYNLMSDEEILNLKIKSIMSKRSVLFLWSTSPRLNFAIKCIRKWGLYYRGVAFVWVKTKTDGTPMKACGVRPSIIKPTTEFVLAASTIEKGRPLPLASEAVCQVVFAPRKQHSQKPIEVYERIEQLYPEMSKIELFARAKRQGWKRWGNEAPE